MTYRKHFIPLESNPELFTQLAQDLGLSDALEFHDIFSLEPDLLALIPRPAYALVLVFPTSPAYEQYKAEEEARLPQYSGCGAGEPVFWVRQTINNACGLYGILHAICSGDARGFLKPGSFLDRLFREGIKLKPTERAQFLEDSAELETAYRQVALQGDTEPPSNPEDEVDFHYICIVKSHKNGHIYELDGDRKGPVDRGLLPHDEDVLGSCGLNLIKGFIARETGGDNGFSLLALAPSIEQ